MKVVLRQAKQLPQRVYDALDALVLNKTAIATDEIKQVIEQNPQLIELQLSLGRLYRLRGENDLAIKLHSKLLISQYILSGDIKDKVRLELAEDFQKAGLIDRAESLLLHLLKSPDYNHHALERLLYIYQQDKNWAAAIDTAGKLATSDYNYHTEVAQFNCELALEFIIKSKYDEANEYLAAALATNRKCVRANIILGDTYFDLEKYAEAIEVWQAIDKQNYLFLPRVLDKMFEAYLRSNQIKQGLTLLKGYVKLHPQLNIHDIVYQKLLNYDTRTAATEYLRQVMASHPSSKVAALLIDATGNEVINQNDKMDVQRIKNLLLKYNEKLTYYRCGACNFKSKTFFWQCPACYSWETINPNNLED